MKHNQVRQVLFPILAALIWGTAFVAQDLCADAIDTFTFNAIRSYIAVAALLVLDRRALLGVDWGLLVTFAAFFTFSGNMARIDPVRELFRKLLIHGVMPVAALTSQVISNVPAAILLSRFTDDYRGLLVGVNIGGAGTLVASLASLITFREYTKHVKGQTGRFMALFSVISFGFLAILLAAMTLLA